MNRFFFKPLLLGSALLGTALALSACGGGPATVAFDGVPKDGMVFYTADALALPKVVFKDKDGKVLPAPEKMRWDVTPPGVVKLQGDKLVPIKNGNAMLLLQVGKLKAKTTLGVTLIDKISLRCSPRNCTVPPGDTVTFSADAESEGAPVVGPKLTWSVVDEKIAKMVSPGKFTGVKAGLTVVKVHLGENIETTHRVQVKDPVDELIVTCPKPKLTFSVHRKKGRHEPRDACRLKRGKKVMLGWKVLAAGEEDPVRHPDWRSGNMDVAKVLDGVLLGIKGGATVIEATVDALTVRIPVSVE